MVTGFKQESDMQVTLETEGASLLLDTDRSTQLVRIAREGLLNASRHGQARHAFIICSNQGTHGRLCVQDDGLGFVPGQLPTDGRKHFGLSIMQARAERIGGQLSINSRSGQGTRVCVTWPLETH
jgi:nitrate/nitrite-specific signal transduction histidine kinase